MFTWLYYSNGAFFFTFWCVFSVFHQFFLFPMFRCLQFFFRLSFPYHLFSHIHLASSCLMQASRSYCRIMYANTYFITHSDRQIASPRFSPFFSPFPPLFLYLSFFYHFLFLSATSKFSCFLFRSLPFQSVHFIPPSVYTLRAHFSNSLFLLFSSQMQ